MEAPEENEPVPVADARSRWLVARRDCVTATDIAKILGLSKFGNALSVYLDKIGEAPEIDQNAQPLKWGRRAEPMILRGYHEDVAPLVMEPPFTLIRSTREPLIGATLDARRELITRSGGSPECDGRPVDAKNIRHDSAEWGPNGTDQMPLYYAAQLVGQMFVTETKHADLAVLFGGNDDRVYTLEHVQGTEDNIIEQCVNFWNNHVVPRVPPPIDGSETFKKYLAQKFAKHTDTILRATPEHHEWAVKLAASEEQLDNAQVTVEELRNKFRAAIGEGNAKAIEGPRGSWKASWSLSADSTGTGWESIAKAVALELAAVTGRAATHIIADLVEQNQIVTRKGSRKFTFTFKG